MTSTKSLWIPAKTVSKAILSGLIAVMTLLAGNKLMATTYYSGAATGDPTLTTSWWDTTGGTGNNPADFVHGDTFVIQSGHNYTIPTAALNWVVNATAGGTAATVQINSGGTLTFTLGASSNEKLLLGGNFVQNGTVAGTASTSTGTIEFTSNGSWTGSGDLSSPKLNVLVDSGVTLDASGMSAGFAFRSANTDGLTVNGTLNIGTQTINGSGGGTTFATFGPNSTLICANTGGLGAIKGSSATGTFYNFNSIAKLTLPTSASFIFNGVAAQSTGLMVNNPVTAGTGTITTTTSSTAVTGSGTSFTSALVGSPLFNSAGTFIGTVASFSSATSMTLAANGAVAVTAGAWSYIPAAVGTITTTTASTGVTGSGTSFTSALVGLPIFDKSGTYIGSVASVSSSTSLTLKANAAVTVSAGAWSSLPSPTVNNLTFNNSLGVTLNQTTTATNLTLTAGKVTGNITNAIGGTISGGSSTTYVNGSLTMSYVASVATNIVFPIGTASAYSPISLTNLTDTVSGTLTASATAAQNPNGGSGIDGSLYVARYWTLTGNGFSSPTYNFTGQYVAGDIQNSANPANFIIKKWNGSSWVTPSSTSSVGSPTYTVTGTGFSASFGQFAIGEPQTTIPIVNATTKSAVTNVSATLGATLTNDFGVGITDYGIVWDTSPNPTTASHKVQVGTTSYTLNSPFTTPVSGFTAATTIYYRGYAVNASGTGYSTNDSFTTLTNEPTIQATGVACTALQNGTIPITWTRGNGANCIVVVKAGSAVNANPVDGVTYTQNATFGSGSQIGTGNYVAYLGTGTSVTLTGLSVNTTYYVAVYELNGSGGSENYLTVSPATGSQLTGSAFATLLTWTGTANTDWNNTGNWNSPIIPDVGTPVLIPSAPANQPVYASPMTPASFGDLTNNGTLNVNASGFNCGNVLLTIPGGGEKLFINSGGALTSSGVFGLGTNAQATLAASASMSVSNLVVAYNTGNLDSHAYFTNNGGTLTSLRTTLNNSGSSTVAPHLVINGGNNQLGITTVGRAHNSSVNTLGTDGLVINNGVVTMTNLTASSASFGSVYISGGTVTNYGAVTINDSSTGGRYMRVVQSGGLFVVSDPNIVYLNTTAVGAETAQYQVTGGTNYVGGIFLGASNNAAAATATATVGGTVYVGMNGITPNGAITYTFTLNNGGLFGATADWVNTANMNLSGASSTFTYQTADPAGVPHNMTNNGVLSGGGLNAIVSKTGTGILALNAANTYSGTTLIKAGTLALGASGSLASTPVIVGNGTLFDVSAVSGGYNIPSGTTISGFGTVTGAVAVATGGSINPGSNSVNGTLNFTNSLTETGTATNHFDLTGTPGAGNDLVVIGSDLNLSGVNYVEIKGGANGNSYALFKYGGTLTGDLSNLQVTGDPGTLSIDSVNHIIYLNSLNTSRSAANITWIGNPTGNDWGFLDNTNWLLGGSLNHFMDGDNVLFDNTGAGNPIVNITNNVTPNSTTVNSSANYTLTGTGNIGNTSGGANTLTKSGSGTLIIQNANTYTGKTTVNGGVLEVAQLANGTVASPIGASVSDPSTLLITNATLRYTGSSVSIDRAATLDGSAGIEVVDSSATLTISGSLTGGGSLVKSGTGSLTLSGGNSYTNVTILNAGKLTLNNVTAAGTGPISFNGNSTLALGAVAPANTIILTNYGGLISGGNAGGATSIRAVTGNSNLVLNVTSGVFDLAGSMSSYSGTVTFVNAGGATVRFNGCTGSQLAIWDLGTGTMDLNIRSGSTSNNIGALKGGSSTTLSGRGGSSNNGPTTHYIGANGLSTVFDGVIRDGSGGSSSTTSINKVGSGTLTLTGASTYTGTTTVSAGTLFVNGNDSLASGTVTVNSTLSGIGTIGGNTTVNSGGTLAPGDGVNTGNLTFSGNLSLNATSTNLFWVTSANGVSNAVAVTGNLAPNGSVIKVNTGAALAIGTYTLFSYATTSGSPFNATPVFDVAPAAGASIVDTGSQINLVISSGPSGPGYITNSISGSTLNLTWPAGESWRLVGQTNSLSTGLNTNSAAWGTVTTGVTDGSATITIDPTQPTVFYRLVYP